MAVAESVRTKRKSFLEDAVNLPNALTMMRIVLIPLVLFLLDGATPRLNFWAAFVYVISTVTDFFDGFLARKMGLVSIFGQFLDPLADKLLVMSTLVFMAYQGRLPLLAALAVIVMEARELSITSLRVIAMGEGVSMPATQGGKEKAALQMVAILLLILHHRYLVIFPGFGSIPCDFGFAGRVLLYVSAALALLSGADYMRLFYDAAEAKAKRRAVGDRDEGDRDDD